jgi:rubredoxin
MSHDPIYTVSFTCPDCGRTDTGRSRIPPKAYLADQPERIECPRCRQLYPRAGLIAHHFVTVTVA